MRNTAKTLAFLAASAAALAVGAAVGARQSEPADPAAAKALADARAAAAGLGQELRSLLVNEMERGGPAAAVAACAKGAQARTADYRDRKHVDIRRTSLRHRSPANAPDAWERAGLEAFATMPAAERGSAERWEVVRENGRESLRYLKAVVTAPMCLACHGAPASIPPPVRRALDEAYPDDVATGFATGDVRGAISVRVPLPPRP
jgi:hypothetical protein